jgi:hypothetical protein
MEKISFGTLPLVVKVGTTLALLSSWVIFEEAIVDRYGIWKVLPNYRAEFFCAWDIGALVVVVGGLTWYSRHSLKTKLIGR